MSQTGRASRRGPRGAVFAGKPCVRIRKARGGPPFRERRPQGHVLCGARKAARFTRGFVLRPFFATGVSVAAPCRAWGAAPDVQGVVCWYLLRLGIVFGTVVLALFVPFIDALGVLVPQLFCLPVLAVRLALEKKKP